MSSQEPARPSGQEYDLDSMEVDESEADYDAEETNPKVTS
jgi:hypothetical protein